jgi:MarR family 2-MHQ and catechol resistance regulon transcriptional repressor
MKELAGEATLSRTGLTRLVDRLERAGLLRREPVPEDRRGAYAAITDEGSAMLRRMWPVYEQVLDEAFAARLGKPAVLTRLLEPLGR